jgi:hypothetical protein
VLKEEYLYEVGRSADARPEKNELREYDQRLVEHIIVFYGRGRVDSEGDDNLLETFYGCASVAHRSYALEFVGRSFSHDSATPPPAEVVQRFEALWNRRLAVAKCDPNPAETFGSELAAFGSWVSAKCFPKEWLLTQLNELLQLTNQIDHIEEVAEFLATYSEENSRASVKCLKLLVGSLSDPFDLRMLRTAAYAILRAGINTPDSQVQQEAIELIHEFGRRGQLSFEELLPQGS